MNNSIKNKQNEVTVLAPQDEALDFYFDSLLLTDEDDSGVSGELTIEQRIEPQAVIEKPQPLMRRSQPIIEKAGEENKLVTPGAKQTIGSSSIDGTNSRYIPNKLISKGPVSPKSREAKLRIAERRNEIM